MYILKVKARSFNLNLRSYTLKSAPGRSVSSWSTTIIGFSRECVLFLSDPWILSYMTTCTTDIIGTWHILKMPSWSQRPTQLASKGAMKCPRLHVYLVLSATVRSAESFQLTGICSARSGIVAIDRVAAQQRSIDSTASSGRSSGWSTATCRHREGCRSSRTTLKMGSANKKKRKVACLFFCFYAPRGRHVICLRHGQYRSHHEQTRSACFCSLRSQLYPIRD